VWQQVKRARAAGGEPRAHQDGVAPALAWCEAGVAAVHQVQRPAVRAERCVRGLLDAGAKGGAWGLRVTNIGREGF
jgi:hypothetical protein